MLYTADGKLLAHHAAKDAADPERIKRLDDIRKWIDEVKKAKGGNEDKLFPGAARRGRLRVRRVSRDASAERPADALRWRVAAKRSYHPSAGSLPLTHGPLSFM